MESGFILEQAWSDAASAASLNEDTWGIFGTAISQRAFVIDGCTDYDPDGSAGIFPGAITAAFWHKETLAAALRSTPRQHDALGEHIRRAVEKVGSDFDSLKAPDRPVWTLPCSTLALVELAKLGNGLQVAITGDSSVLCKFGTGEVNRFPLPEPGNGGELEVARLLREPGKASDAQHLRRARREEFLNAGLHCISIFPDRLFGLKIHDVPLADCSWVMLASDGFMRLVDVFAAHTVESLFENAERFGLRQLGMELRELERSNAPTGAAARIKTHDDATAVLLKIA